jgi:hypothetical protein
LSGCNRASAKLFGGNQPIFYLSMLSMAVDAGDARAGLVARGGADLAPQGVEELRFFRG